MSQWGEKRPLLNSVNSRPIYGPQLRTLALAALGLALIAIALALGLGIPPNLPKSDDSFVKMDLHVEVPNALSTLMNKQFSRSAFGWIPPDPHVVAGKETVMVTVNSLVSIYDKKTMERITGPIDGINFFPGLVYNDLLFGDAYSVYDAFHERIWIVAFSFPTGLNVRVSYCVSKNHSPRIASDFYCYKQDFPADPFVDYMKISVDAKYLYMASNDFQNFAPPYGVQERIRVFDKFPLMTGTSPYEIVPVHEILPQAFKSNDERPIYSSFPWPTIMMNTRTATDKVQSPVFVSTPEEFIPTGDFTDNRLLLGRIVDGQYIETVVTVPEYNRDVWFNGSDILNEPGKQPPPTFPSITNATRYNIEVFPNLRIMSPVLSNDRVYACHSIKSTTGNRPLIRWYEIDVSRLFTHGEANLIQYGTIDDGLSDFIFPSMSVDKDGNIAFSFTQTSIFQYPRPMYTAHMKGDPAGSVRFPLRELAPGNEYYQAVSGGRNRYGDYSGIVIDPVDGKTHWIFNQYTERIMPDPRYSFGTAWNTKLGAFKLEQTGGTVANAPQREHFNGGSTVPPSTKKKQVTIPKKTNKARVPHKKMQVGDHMIRWIQKHTPHGENCTRVDNRVWCPPMN